MSVDVLHQEFHADDDYDRDCTAFKVRSEAKLPTLLLCDPSLISGFLDYFWLVARADCFERVSCRHNSIVCQVAFQSEQWHLFVSVVVASHWRECLLSHCTRLRKYIIFAIRPWPLLSLTKVVRLTSCKPSLGQVGWMSSILKFRTMQGNYKNQKRKTSWSVTAIREHVLDTGIVVFVATCFGFCLFSWLCL